MRRNLWLRIGLVVVVVIARRRSGTCTRPQQDASTSVSTSRAASTSCSASTWTRPSRRQVERAAEDLKAELERKGVGVKRVERRGSSELVVELASPQQLERRADGGRRVRPPSSVKEARPGGRPRSTLRSCADARSRSSATCRPPGAGDHPQPRRPVRRGRADHPAAGRQPHPHPAPGRAGSRARQGPHRQDRAARVQAARRADVDAGAGAGRPAARGRRAPLPAAGRQGDQGGAEGAVRRAEEGAADRRRPDHRARRPSTRTRSEPYVSVEFNAAGARAFGELTEANVGQAPGHRARRQRPLRPADPRAHPVRPGRRSPGGFTSEEATDLAIVLRAGALPAPVQVLEERTVGPSLGADSIRQGIIAILGSAVAVVPVHAGLLPAVRPHRRRGARPQPAHPAGGHGRLSAPP